MKNIIFIITNLTLFQLGISQNFTASIKVINIETKVSIVSANVEIEQLPGVNNQTDTDGLAMFEGVPQGRITVRISASGYISQTFPYSHVSTEEKNNYFVYELQPVANSSEYLLFGEIMQKNTDIVGADIEVKVLNNVYKTVSDESGNYFVKVPKSQVQIAKEFRIEVKKDGCEVYKETISAPVQLNVLHDIDLICFSNSPSISSQRVAREEENYKVIERTIGQGYCKIRITDAVYTSEGLELQFKFFHGASRGSHHVGLNSGNKNTKNGFSRINNEGDNYYTTYAKIGDNECFNSSDGHCYVNDTATAQTWINGKVIFGDSSLPRLRIIPNISLSFYTSAEGNIFVSLKDIPVR